MVNASQIQEHAEVIGSDGNHVGTVDHMDGTDRIKLTRTDKDANGEHHYIPLSWVSTAEGSEVKLSKTANEAQAEWKTS